MKEHKVRPVLEELIKDFKRGVSSVDLLESAIESEHQAILKHNLVELQNNTEKKTQIVEDLNNQIAQVFDRVKGLFSSIQKDENSRDKEVNISFVVNKLNGSLKDSGTIEDERMKDCILSFSEQATIFLKKVNSIRPLVQKNQIVISQFLLNCGQSLSFWEQIKLDQSSSYDEKGSKSSTLPVNHFVAEV